MVDGECLLQSVGRQVSVCPKPTDVVDQHVEPRVGVEDRDGESPDLGLGTHVGAERIDGRVSRGGTNGGGDLFGPPEVATRDPDPGTDGRQPDRGGLPDSSGATSYENDLTGHRECTSHSPRLRW